MFSCTGLGGGVGYVGAARWHTGKEVTTATWWWLKVHMMPVKMRRNLQPTCHREQEWRVAAILHTALVH